MVSGGRWETAASWDEDEEEVGEEEDDEGWKEGSRRRRREDMYPKGPCEWVSETFLKFLALYGLCMTREIFVRAVI